MLRRVREVGHCVLLPLRLRHRLAVFQVHPRTPEPTHELPKRLPDGHLVDVAISVPLLAVFDDNFRMGDAKAHLVLLQLRTPVATRTTVELVTKQVERLLGRLVPVGKLVAPPPREDAVASTTHFTLAKLLTVSSERVEPRKSHELLVRGEALHVSDGSDECTGDCWAHTFDRLEKHPRTTGFDCTLEQLGCFVFLLLERVENRAIRPQALERVFEGDLALQDSADEDLADLALEEPLLATHARKLSFTSILERFPHRDAPDFRLIDDVERIRVLLPEFQKDVVVAHVTFAFAGFGDMWRYTAHHAGRHQGARHGRCQAITRAAELHEDSVVLTQAFVRRRHLVNDAVFTLTFPLDVPGLEVLEFVLQNHPRPIGCGVFAVDEVELVLFGRKLEMLHFATCHDGDECRVSLSVCSLLHAMLDRDDTRRHGSTPIATSNVHVLTHTREYPKP